MSNSVEPRLSRDWASQKQVDVLTLHMDMHSLYPNRMIHLFCFIHFLHERLNISCSAVKIQGQKHFLKSNKTLNGPIGWCCRIDWLHLCRWVRPPKDCSKQSDREASVILELWRIRNTPSLPLVPSSLWPVMVAPDWVLSMIAQVPKKLLFIVFLFFNLIIYRCVFLFT